MNLILHQFKTDALHFRGRLIVLWVAFAIWPVMSALHSLSGEGMGVTVFFLGLFQIFFGVALVVSLIQADPLAGDSAAWLCRPIRRRHLFWSKSAFIIVCLMVPWVAMWFADWAIRGYSWRLGLDATAELLMLSAAGVLVVAVLAALTPSTARFFLAAGIVTGGIFAWVVIVEMLTRMKILPQTNHNELVSLSALTVAWVVLGVCAFVAWLCQAGAGRPRNAIAWLALGLLPFPVINTVWSGNFLSPKLSSAVPLTLSLPGTNGPAAGLSGQWVSSEFFLTGVPDRQVAVIQYATETAHFQGSKKTENFLTGLPQQMGTRTRPGQSGAMDQYLSIIRDYFPADTVWFLDNYYSGLSSVLYTREVEKLYPNQQPPPAKLDGGLTVDLYAVQKAAELPLDYASVVVQPGVRVTIHKVTVANGAIGIAVEESAANLMFDRAVDTGHNKENQALCTYVLYQPGSGEAFMMQQNNYNSVNYVPSLIAGENQRLINLSFPYSSLREKLSGMSAYDWLKDARLVVFTPRYTGTATLDFHQDNYTWSSHYQPSIRDQREKDADMQAIEQAALPADHTPAQLETYLDQILLNVPGDRNAPSSQIKAQNKIIKNKLAAIGADGVPALLNRLPLAMPVEEGVVFPVITNLITRDQLPGLCAALQRDDRVVEVFTALKWEADARPVLLAELPDHRHLMSADSLRIAAGAKDPATYRDLRWRFVHLNSQHDEVIDVLEQCPGFDVAGAVQEAWQYARLGQTSPADLAAIAARQNLPDALDRAVARAIELQGERGQRLVLDRLIPLTGYTGPTNSAIPWLVANLNRFQYDPAQQRYTLGAAQ